MRPGVTHEEAAAKVFSFPSRARKGKPLAPISEKAVSVLGQGGFSAAQTGQALSMLNDTRFF